MKRIFLLSVCLITAVVSWGKKDRFPGEDIKHFTLPIEYVSDPGSNGLTGPEEEKRPNVFANVTKAEMTVYLPAVEEPVSCVILFPGGGYDAVQIDHVGLPGAEFFTSHGIAAVSVKYRLPNGHIMVPITDGQQAIRMVRQHAEEWNIIPDRIGILGSSAGGHLASMLAVHWVPAVPDSEKELERYTSRPDFVILLKAAINWSRGHTMSNSHGPDPTEETIHFCNALNYINDRHMPTFIAHCSDDPAAPAAGTVNYFLKLRELGIPAELHVFDHGGHGIGFGKKNRPMDQWMDALLAWKYLYPDKK